MVSAECVVPVSGLLSLLALLRLLQAARASSARQAAAARVMGTSFRGSTTNGGRPTKLVGAGRGGGDIPHRTGEERSASPRGLLLPVPLLVDLRSVLGLP